MLSARAEYLSAALAGTFGQEITWAGFSQAEVTRNLVKFRLQNHRAASSKINTSLHFWVTTEEQGSLQVPHSPGRE